MGLLPVYFVFVGMAINFAGSVGYFIETLQGRVKPNKISWGLWAFISIIAFTIQYSETGSSTAYFTLVAGLIPLCVFVASFFNKNAYWKLSMQDYIAGAISVIAIAIWLLADEPVLALSFSILADLSAAVPTLHKAYTEPLTETALPYASAGVGALLSILASERGSEFLELAYAVYIFMICIILAGTIIVRKKSVLKRI